MNDERILKTLSTALLYPHTQARYAQDIERLILESRRIMGGIYCPSVTNFMLELAKARGRLQQLRDMVGMGLKVDDLRRIIMAELYISPRQLMELTSQDMTKFIWEIPFRQYGRLRIIWSNFWYRLRLFLP